MYNRFCSDIKSTLKAADMRRKEMVGKQKGLEGMLKQAKRDLRDHKKAIMVIEYIINKNYDKVIGMFESAITSALVDMFDERHRFKFEMGKRGEATTCNFMVDTGKGEGFLDVKENEGTALAEIVATIIQLIIVKLDKTMPDFILLDEPFGGLENDRQVIAGKFLKNICKEFGLQLIVITQSPIFAENIGGVYKVVSHARKSKSVKIQV